MRPQFTAHQRKSAPYELRIRCFGCRLIIEIRSFPPKVCRRPSANHRGIAAQPTMAHGEHERRIGASRSEMAGLVCRVMVREQSGEELPQ